MFSLFRKDPQIDIKIDGNPELKKKYGRIQKQDIPIYGQNETVQGTISVVPPEGKTISHQGVNLKLFGEFRNEKGEVLSRFFVRSQFLTPAGVLSQPINTEFKFDHLSFPTSSYYGTSVNVYYGVEVVIVHRISDFIIQKPFDVLIFSPAQKDEPIHNEVGIKNVLHIEFVFPKSWYDVEETVCGAAYFILVKLRIVHMSVSVYRNEIYEDNNTYFKTKTVLKTYEIMDGAPVRGDNIPIRLYMGDSDIWSYTKFRDSPLRVEQFLRVQLIDENGKKYFKRMKINFDRFESE